MLALDFLSLCYHQSLRFLSGHAIFLFQFNLSIPSCPGNAAYVVYPAITHELAPKNPTQTTPRGRILKPNTPNKKISQLPRSRMTNLKPLRQPFPKHHLKIHQTKPQQPPTMSTKLRRIYSTTIRFWKRFKTSPFQPTTVKMLTTHQTQTTLPLLFRKPHTPIRPNPTQAKPKINKNKIKITKRKRPGLLNVCTPRTTKETMQRPAQTREALQASTRQGTNMYPKPAPTTTNTETGEIPTKVAQDL